MSLDILASGTPLELLESDARAPENRLLEHPVWVAALDGTMPRAQLKRLLLAVLPAVAGPGRYAFAAKVSQISPADGKALFLALYDTLRKPEANADAGLRRVLVALGATGREVDRALEQPSAEALDFVEVVKSHGLRSGAAEAAVIAHLFERHLPRLWGRLAEALERSYGVPKAATTWLRYEAGRADAVDAWVAHLVASYVADAEPYRMYEARRAGREAVWAWTVLTESAT